jgi:DNA-directed RNA polymerase specialized sigma24 family protein
MLVDELSTKDSLVRMVRRMTANLALREDLLQEALIHLWLTEARRPGQTRSWYLQSCKYHLLHYLASGRSVDSGKRRAGQLQPSRDSEHCDSFPEEVDSGNSVFTWVSARDIIALLSPQLLPQEKAVLHCFADGLGPREIGRKLKMSHTMVIKHRRKIALLFTRLDVPVSRRAGINGFKLGNGHPDRGQTGITQYQPLGPAPANGHNHTNGRNHTNGCDSGANQNGNGHNRANGYHRHAKLNGYANRRFAKLFYQGR